MTEQKKIRYRDIMDLGFSEQVEDDELYEDEFGFQYCIITKNLTKTLYLDWEKNTGLCKLVRIDKPKECNIMAQRPVRDLAHLTDIIDFFTNK